MPVHVIADRVQETTATTGTGTITLAGAAAQCQAFLAAVGDGNECDYVLLGGNGTDWETGRTIVHTGPALSRDTVFTSTNGGAKISLTGTSTVFLTPTANLLYGRQGRRPTRPPATSFAWGNQGSAGFTDWAGGPLTLTTPQVSLDNQHALIQAALAPTYTVTLEIESFSWQQSFDICSLVIVDNAGKLIAFGYQTGAASNEQLVINKWNSYTSFSANTLGQAINPQQRHWLRIRDDGVNHIFFVSHNGADWIQILSQSRTAFLTSTISSVGLSISASGTAAPAGMAMSVWSFENVSGSGSNVQWV